ncbi:SAICAR synthase-like protein [Ramicandelaber brevisporus]|nr:SAICAR synthase-like protein [Ramicandelaber brevisporus]KAI8868199.1 SAICAR synthase-like protein [Ramicandelaber brevisporus]
MAAAAVAAAANGNCSEASYSPFDSQVAGHGNIMMSVDGSTLVKPSTEAERVFYEVAFGATTADGSRQPLADFLPRYYGTLDAHLAKLIKQVKQKPKLDVLISLENLTASFSKPCILDVKIGTRLHDDYCTPEKREKMIAKAKKTTTGSLGVYISGVSHFNTEDGSQFKLDRMCGRQYTQETIYDGFEMFLPPRPEYRQAVIKAVLDRVDKLRQALVSTNGSIRPQLYASSILIIYDTAASDIDTSINTDIKLQFKLIDFAHSEWAQSPSTDGQTYDEQYIFGLDNLHRIFTNCLHQA